jgi:hypothetical protein
VSPKERARRRKELEACKASCAHFINNYCHIYDATRGEWVRFDLWAAQETTLEVISLNQMVVILKARQLGLTWLVLAFALWLLLFHPISTVLLFSLRDNEAVHLLSDERLRGMFLSLPDWMRPEELKTDAHVWRLSNGSTAKAFPTSAGDSYTATLAIVDEADLVPDLNKLMRRVKPTIDGGGKMILLSRSDKSQPQSEFKKIYRAAKQKLTKWVSVFLPWDTRPERSPDWYAEQKAEIFNRTGSLDDLHEQYPSTDTEALSPRSLDKRIPPAWIEQCYRQAEPFDDAALSAAGAPSINGLRVYALPVRGKRYVVGGDPAEGNPTSDDSALVIKERETGEQCAVLQGKFQPSTLAAHADALGTFYNRADLLIERNNHGHAVLLWLQDNSTLKRLRGYDGKPGWPENTRTKALLYDAEADAFRDEDTVIHDFAAYVQLASIEGSTLNAPTGEMDDLADADALATLARTLKVSESTPTRSYSGVSTR